LPATTTYLPFLPSLPHERTNFVEFSAGWGVGSGGSRGWAFNFKANQSNSSAFRAMIKNNASSRNELEGYEISTNFTYLAGL
jgi:hypothetical protein